MTHPCQKPSLIKRNGTNRLNRSIAALSPSSFQVDERNIADFILFAKHYSKHIRFYNTPADTSDKEASKTQSWQVFFEKDISVALASIANIDCREAMREQNLLIDLIQTPSKQLLNKRPDLLVHAYAAYFHLAFRTLHTLLTEIAHIPEYSHALETAIKEPAASNAIKGARPAITRNNMLKVLSTHLLPSLEYIIAFIKGAQLALPDFNEGLIELEENDASTIANLSSIDVSRLLLRFADGTSLYALIEQTLNYLNAFLLKNSLSFSSPISSPISSQGIEMEAISAELRVYGLGIDAESDSDAINEIDASQTHARLEYATRYNLLSDGVSNLFSSIETISSLGFEQLESVLSLEGASNLHQPHYALWLAFLRLYQYPQAELNQFTERHLQFYFSTILRMQAKPAMADTALIHLELKPGIESLYLEAGTLFDGQKDEYGEQRLYQTKEACVLNQAKIVKIKALNLRAVDSRQSAMASQFLESAETPWPLFGYSADFKAFSDNNSNENVNATPVVAGFALADESFLLSDGARRINLRLNLIGTAPSVSANMFSVAVTTEEAWLNIPSAKVNTYKRTNRVDIAIDIDADAPPLLPLSAKASQALGFSPYIEPGLTTAKEASRAVRTDSMSNKALPLVKITLKAGLENAKDWEKVKVASVETYSEVEGSRAFNLSNQLGALDKSKAFMPFGARPTKGDALIMGGAAIFASPLSQLQFDITWQTPLVEDDVFYNDNSQTASQVKVSKLVQGRWQSHAQSRLAFFNTSAPSSAVSLSNVGGGVEFQTVESLNDAFSATAKNGFIKLTLDSDFGHAAYPQENALAIMGKAEGFSYSPKSNINYNTDGLPKAPFLPVIDDMLINYTSIRKTPARRYHLHPFGLAYTSSNSLFAQYSSEGECYFGVENLKPGQLVSLLFDAVDGSGNPLSDLAKLNWSYLLDDEWKALTLEQVQDTTLSLSGSGLIRFTLPMHESANNRYHTFMRNDFDSDLTWIKVEALENSAAVAQIHSVYLQGLELERSRSLYDSDVLDASLLKSSTDMNKSSFGKTIAENTISKLFNLQSTLSAAQAADAARAIKKISQTKASFKGRAAETADDFYQRSSERLRHKDRAVCVWDYEHLLLGEFDDVFSVKCLAHTHLCSNDCNEGINQDKDHSSASPEHKSAVNAQHPGKVLVVPLPDLRKQSNVDAFRPYNSLQRIAQMQSFINARKPIFADVKIINPKIEVLKLSFDVALADFVTDSSYYLHLLNTAINHFLMPWATDLSASETLGNASSKNGAHSLVAPKFTEKWHKASIVDFIDELPYVHYVKNVMMFHQSDIQALSTSNSAVLGAKSWLSQDFETLIASSPYSLIVGDYQHDIRLIEEALT
uniref:hypothetical protein n=1 Tax=Ningiella ruwaisensis TaxID=2364274 RepID=UPI00109FDCBF|nr:hypothetical protein [Ningiella ruwaisensis]